MRLPKLAVFDIDGTIANHGVIAPEVIAGAQYLQSKGVITTVATGRAYSRLRRMEGVMEHVISDDALLIIEHGTQVVDKHGKILFSSRFRPDELDHIVDFTRANSEIFTYAFYGVADPTEKTQVWVLRSEDMPAVQTGRLAGEHIFHESFTAFRQRIDGLGLSKMAFKLVPHVQVENFKLHFTRSAVTMMMMDGNLDFVRNNANKALAIEFAAKELGIKTEDILVAGNAINDIDMLSMDGPQRALVGTGVLKEQVLGHLQDTKDMIFVDSPEALGKLLQKF